MVQFRDWVEETFVPLVITSASAEVERICQKNGLTFTELISAFSFVEGANAPVRTVTHHYNLTDVRIRFLPATELAPVPLETIDKFITDAVARYPPDDNLLDHPRMRDALDAERFAQSLGPDPTPWFTAFRNEVVEAFRCQEQDMFHCPAAMICAIASSETNCVELAHELSHEFYLPKVFQQGQYDPNIPKFYVIVHDVTEFGNIDPLNILAQMRGQFSASACKVLRINSLPPDRADTQQYDLWSSHPYVRKPYFPEAMRSRNPPVTDRPGCLLDHRDLEELRNFVWDLALRGVLPALESRLHNLNATVSAVRKGLKNQLKSWWRKPKESTSTFGASSVLYRFDSIESQIRLLADTAFILRDYDFAQAMYRLVREDFKSDKAQLHFAHVNEMIALCMFMGNGSKRDIAATLGFMNDASIILLRASTSEQALPAALLLERAAICDLQNQPSLFRKYAFHLVMAGHTYHTCNQDKHAVRCYAASVGVYEGQKWVNIDDHINFTLARQLFSLGNPQAAIRFFLKLIASGRQPQQQQATFLREFLYVVRTTQQMNTETTGPINIPNLCLPLVEDHSVKVYVFENALGDHPVLVSDAQKAEVPEDKEWNSLENSMTDDELIHDKASQGLSNWFDPPAEARFRGRLGRKRVLGAPKQRVVGEEIAVDVELKNPLSVPVDITEAELFGIYSSPNEPSTFIPADAEKLTVEKVAISIPAAEKAVVRFKLIPRAVGNLRIVGLRWLLFGEVWGSREFQLRGPLLHDTREHRATGARAPNTTLWFSISEPMPLLGVKLKESPETLIAGEIRTLHLHLRNSGAAKLGGLRVKCDSPILCIGRRPTGEQTSLKSLLSVSNNDIAPTLGPSGTLIDLGALELEPSEEVTLPLWIRGVGNDKQVLRMLFRYKAVGENSGVATAVSGLDGKEEGRLLRFSFQVVVRSSINVSAFVRPSYDTCGDYVLGVSLTNCRGDGKVNDKPIRIHQITSVSKNWQIGEYDVAERNRKAMEVIADGPLAQSSKKREKGPGGEVVLHWRESCTLYFRLHALPEQHPEEGLRYSFISIANERKEKENSISSASNDNLRYAVATSESCPSPMLNFLCLEQAASMMQSYKQRKKEERRSQANSMPKSISSVRRENKLKGFAYSSDLTPCPTDVKALTMNNSELHLAISWSADVGTEQAHALMLRTAMKTTAVQGQHFVRGVTVRPQLNTRYCPLTINVLHSTHVQHDFHSHHSLCQIPVKLLVRNGSAPSSPPITFSFETLQPYDSRGVHAPQGQTKTPAPRIYWSGTTRKKVHSLAPGGVEEISLQACFPCPGVFNLNRFRFVVENAPSGQKQAQNAVVFVFPTQYLVFVEALQGPAPERKFPSPHPPSISSPRHGEEKFGAFKTFGEVTRVLETAMETPEQAEGPSEKGVTADMDAVELGAQTERELEDVHAHARDKTLEGDLVQAPLPDRQEESVHAAWAVPETGAEAGESIVTDEIMSPVLDDSLLLHTAVTDYVNEEENVQVGEEERMSPRHYSEEEDKLGGFAEEEEARTSFHHSFHDGHEFEAAIPAKPTVPASGQVLFTAGEAEQQGAGVKRAEKRAELDS